MNHQQLRGLIEGLAAEKHEAGSIAQKVGELYNIAMDSVKLNKEGAAPIKPELEKIGARQGSCVKVGKVNAGRKYGLFLTVASCCHTTDCKNW